MVAALDEPSEPTLVEQKETSPPPPEPAPTMREEDIHRRLEATHTATYSPPEKTTAEDKALEERQAAFDEAKAESVVIQKEVVHLETPMSEEQFQADFSDAEPSGPTSAKVKAQVSKVDKAIMDKLVEVEEAVVDFEVEMRSAGKELGAEASEAYARGDYIEAFAKGTAAFSARAGVGIIDAATFPVRPLAIAKTVGALVEGGKEAIEHPEDIPEGVNKWVENIVRDPGSIAEFAGDLATGFAFGEVIKTIKGSTHQVSRLDAVDIDVKSSTLKMVDDVDSMGLGDKFKVPQMPEAEITPTLSSKKVPKIASEIIEAELDDISGPGRILGVADEGGITSLDKIEVTEGMIDDLSQGKTVKVEGVVEVENVGLGGESYRYVEDIPETLTGESRSFAKEGNILPIDAKEVGSTIDVLEDASPLKALSLEGDEIITTPPPDIQSSSVKFESNWGDEGVKGILDEGEHTYKVLGVEIDAPPQIIDEVLNDIKPIEPPLGPKTPLAEHFQQPGYTAPLGEIPDALAKDIDIVRELTNGVKPVSRTTRFIDDIIKTSDDLLLEDITQGTRPIAKIIETPPKIPTELITGPSVARATGKKTGPPGMFDELGKIPGILDGPPKPGKDRYKLPNPYFENPIEQKRDEDSKKKTDEETTPFIIDDPKPKPTPKTPPPIVIEDPKPKPKPRPPPPIVIEDPKPKPWDDTPPKPKPKDPPPTVIEDPKPKPKHKDPPPIVIEVEDPRLDTPQKPLPVMQETVTDPVPFIPFSAYLGSSRRKKKRGPSPPPKKRRPKILQFTPHKIGFEDRKYRIRTPKEMMGTRRSKRRPNLSMPQLPDNYNLSKPKKKRRKKK